MTRFWITLDQAVDLVFLALRRQTGGEIFIPKIPSMRIMELAEAIDPGGKRVVTGLRPGEKIFETLITEDEAPIAHYVPGSGWVIRPEIVNEDPHLDGWSYNSRDNPQWLTVEDLRKILGLTKETKRVKHET